MNLQHMRVWQKIGEGVSSSTLVNRMVKNGTAYGIFRQDYLDLYSVVNMTNGSYEFGGADSEKTCMSYIMENL